MEIKNTGLKKRELPFALPVLLVLIVVGWWGAPGAAQEPPGTWTRSSPEVHAEVLEAVVTFYFSEEREILQGRCPGGPFSDDCDAVAARSAGQDLLARVGPGRVVLAMDPDPGRASAQFEDLEQRAPALLASTLARLRSESHASFVAGEVSPLRSATGGPDGFVVTSSESGGVVAICALSGCTMEDGVAAVILVSYPAVVTELPGWRGPPGTFAELNVHMYGDVRQLGADHFRDHSHPASVRVARGTDGWYAAWEGLARYVYVHAGRHPSP